MHVPTNGQRRLGFGLFEADLAARELYRRGVLVHVQDKPFQILTMLLERPGEVVTREELQKKLWSDDTFVEFDDGLNTAIRKLRYALGDSPDNPTFIETVPRQGYRFIAPVRTVSDAAELQESEKVREQNLRPQWAVDLQEELKDLKGKTESHTLTLDRPAVLPEAHFNPASPYISVIPGSVVRERTRQRWMAWALSLLLAVGVGFGVDYFRRLRAPQRAMHFSVPLRTAMRDLAISHDGRILAFVAPLPRDGGAALWLHEVGGSGARVLENTEGASYPFWSPDDGFIAFFADGKMKRIPAAGGPVQVICDAPIGRGGAWNSDGIIVFAADNGVGIRRVSEAGGQATLAPGFEQKAATTMSNRWPVFLPDGNHFLYTSVDFGADLHSEANAIYVAALDSSEHRRLVTSNGNAAYVPPGYLLFSRSGTLMAQRFDTDRLQITGEAFAITNEAEYLSSVARALFSVSENGTLVYQKGSGATFSQLAWFDREGKQLGTLGPPARYANPRLSPDGKRVAVDIDDAQSSNTDVWLIEANHQFPLRFTFDPSQDEAPLWSHDGRRILWLSDRGGRNGFYLKASDGSGNEKSLTGSAGVDLSFASAPSDWSPDGRFVLYTDLQEGDVLHLWVLSLNGARKPYRFLPGASADVEGQFSPDGRWVAYCSNESGRWQVYVEPFPDPGSKYQISTDGGQQPRWRRDGRELFFLSSERKLMTTAVKPGPTFEFSAPTALFETRAHEPLTAEEFFTYDVSADGQRFLINVSAEQTNPPPVDITLNWASQLTK